MKKKNKFKKSTSIWNEEFQLLDGSYSLSDSQHYFDYIIKTLETVIDNPSIMIYINKIENRITFRIKTRYYFEPLMPKIKTMKLCLS